MSRINGDRRIPGLPSRAEKISVPLWVVVVGLVGRLCGRLVLALVRHPVTVSVLVMLTVFYQQTGILGLGALSGAVLLASGVWRLAHRASFDRAARWTWGRVRLLVVYRRRWRAATVHCGLAIRLPASNAEQVTFDEYFPRIRGFLASAAVESLRVELLPGQTPDLWAEQAEALRHIYRARSCRVRADAVGFVWVDFYRRDPLAKTVPPGRLDGADSAADLGNLAVGRREDGAPWLLPLRGSHVLIAGATGAGKGSVLWSLIRALGPAVAAGLAELWVCDPKGGMEMAAGAPLFARFAYDLPSIADLLDDAVTRMQTRADGLRGVSRLHVPTPGDPLIVVVVDEIASLTSYVTDRDLKRRLSASIPLLLSQGRAPGLVVVAAVQDPRKETLPFRDLFPVRVGLRLAEGDQVDLVLGDGAHDHGARCEDIPPSLPGTGFVTEEGSPEPVRVRAGYPDDAEITRTVERYRPSIDGPAALPAAPERLALPAPTLAAEVAQILQARGFGNVAAHNPPPRRRWLHWPRRRPTGPSGAPGTSGALGVSGADTAPPAGAAPEQAGGWIPDLDAYRDLGTDR
jgi:S-DNA-T family DNA segregation ATPase FtsK/SpoIIIE